MKKKYIVANWKMYSISLADAKSYADYFANQELPANAQAIVCPQFPYLHVFSNHERLTLGAQNCAEHEKGAYTGETGAFALKESGVKYVLIGHSERRNNESNAVIKTKMVTAKACGLTPILCVGEPLEVYQQKQSLEYVMQQVKECLGECKEVIVAYEPIWAIGSGLTPTHEEIKRFAFEFKKGYSVPLLYGGSVNAEFVTQIVDIADVDGVLVGYASTQPEEFRDIILNFCRNNA